MIFRERVETITDTVECCASCRIAFKGMELRTFRESLRRENFRWADLVQGT